MEEKLGVRSQSRCQIKAARISVSTHADSLWVRLGAAGIGSRILSEKNWEGLQHWLLSLYDCLVECRP